MSKANDIHPIPPFPSLAFSDSEQSRHRRRGCRQICPQWSISIAVVLLVPSIVLMLVVSLVSWFLVYHTASNAVEVVATQGQKLFVQSIRDNILAFTDSMQRMHIVNKPEWDNTTCNGVAPNPNQTAFDAYGDVRATLYSQVYGLTEGDVVLSVGFPNGAALGYHRARDGSKSWMIIDGSTDFWMLVVTSDHWNDTWRTGPSYSTKPNDLLASGEPFNMTARDWFVDAVQAGRQCWSAAYYSLVVGSLAMGAALPVYNPDGSLKLVANAQTSLDNLDQIFTRAPLTPNTFGFVSDASGDLLATVPGGLATVLSVNQSDNLVQAVNSNSSLGPAAQWLVEQFGSLAGIPAADSSFLLHLDGQPHWLFTGHIEDSYGLHWVVVVGVPESDLTGDLERATTWAIVIVVSVLGLSVLLMGAVPFSIRNTLKVFAHRIELIGLMNLEEADSMRHTVYLSEANIILASIRTTIDNLLQMRTFLPQPMLEKVQLEDAVARPSLRRCRSRSEGPLASEGKSELGSPRHFDPETPFDMQRVVAATFERHLASTPVTVLFIRLSELHSLPSVEGGGLPPADLLQWYEAGIGAATAVCQRSGGDFHRLLGDVLLFTWGAVRPTGAQCVKACHAALGVREALEALDAKAPAGLPKYDATFAVLTGNVLCGVMGTAQRRDFHVIGSLISRGQRLVNLNSEYATRVLVDSSVAQQCQAMFRMKVCGLMEGRKPQQPPDVQFVWELAEAIPEPQGDNSEWMYQLEVQTDGLEALYHQAMDALLKGQLAKASRDLQAVLLQCPEHPHAGRLLRRVSALDPTRHGVEALVD